MVVVKWIFLIALVSLVIWLTIDTIVMIVKKVKAKRKAKEEQLNNSKLE